MVVTGTDGVPRVECLVDGVRQMREVSHMEQYGLDRPGFKWLAPSRAYPVLLRGERVDWVIGDKMPHITTVTNYLPGNQTASVGSFSDKFGGSGYTMRSLEDFRMLVCPKCGNQLYTAEEQAYCQRCGSPLTGKEEDKVEEYLLVLVYDLKLNKAEAATVRLLMKGSEVRTPLQKFVMRALAISVKNGDVEPADLGVDEP